jgi:hypothetical protein
MDDGEPKSRYDAAQYGRAKVSKNEALFIECVLAATAEAGVLPPPELGLPKSVGKVVDYDAVKKLMKDKMLREDDNTPDGEKRHRERVKSAVRRAREGLMHIKVVSCHNPYIWWTGKPVGGVKATYPKQTGFFDRGNDEAPLSAGPHDDPFGEFIT